MLGIFSLPLMLAFCFSDHGVSGSVDVLSTVSLGGNLEFCNCGRGNCSCSFERWSQFVYITYKMFVGFDIFRFLYVV